MQGTVYSTAVQNFKTKLNCIYKVWKREIFVYPGYLSISYILYAILKSYMVIEYIIHTYTFLREFFKTFRHGKDALDMFSRNIISIRSAHENIEIPYMQIQFIICSGS